MPFSDSPHEPTEGREPSQDKPPLEKERPLASAKESPNESAQTPRIPPIPLSPDTITFHDANGALWWAHEVSGKALGDPRPLCLLFISGMQLRRVWSYPANWRSLTPEELFALAESGE